MDYVEQVFGAAGLLASKFPGYTPRAGQLQLVREIEAAISGAEHTIAEAPTGTGKSIAYLVPAIWPSSQNTARSTRAMRSKAMLRAAQKAKSSTRAAAARRSRLK